MSSDSTLPDVPTMHAEAGYEPDSAPPLRVTGFVCLLLGLLSFTACFGAPLLVIPVAGVAFGLVALRRSDGKRPVGTTAAMIGMLLAVGFGSCGLFLPWFKNMTLGAQAVKFSRDYLKVVASGDDYFAIELGKDYVNRYPPTMSLKEHYASSEMGQRALEEYRNQSIFETIRKSGPDARWELDGPVRIYYSFGREHADMVWRDPATGSKVRLFLDYRVDSKGNGQWHVDKCVAVAPLYTAPAIL